MNEYDFDEYLRAIGWAMWFAFLGGILVFSCVLFLQLAILAVLTGSQLSVPSLVVQISGGASLFGFVGGGVYGWMRGLWYF